MNNETRAAVERYRLHEAIIGPDYRASPYFSEGAGLDYERMRRDEWLMRDGYLAEHPADGDELVTEDWLRSIGASDRLNGEWLVADPRTLDECVEVWCIFTDDGGPPGITAMQADYEDAPCIIANCTRSKLRKLLEALGAKL